MALVSNIHYNLVAWASGTYTLGQRLSTGGNAYQCIVAGLSTAAPTGTGSSISNGGAATFKWLSAIDFTSIQAWQNAIPSTLTQPVIGQLWNNGAIGVDTSGPVTGAFCNITGHVTSTSNTITLTTAPGESFRDTLKANSALPLAFSTSTGVALLASGSPGGNFIQIDDDNVILSNIQVQDPTPTSGTSLMLVGRNIVIQNCIFDATSQAGIGMVNAFPFTGPDASSTAKFLNCLFVDRVGNADPGSVTLSFFYPGIVANCALETVNAGTNVSAIVSIDPPTANVRVTNSIISGYTSTWAMVNYAASTFTVDHTIFSCASPLVDTTVSIGTGVTFSVAGSSVFVADGTNFRLSNTSAALNGGATDTTDIPTATDILGTSRPQSTSWDIGPFELPATMAVQKPLIVAQEYPLDHPTRGRSFVRSGVNPGPSTATRKNGNFVFLRQEQPPPNVSFVGPSRVINFAASPRLWGNYAVTTQEQPRHPAPFVKPSLPGRGVAAPSIRRSIFTTVEQPPPNKTFTFAGVPGPDVIVASSLDATLTIDPLGPQTVNTAFVVTGSYTLYPQLSFTDDAGGTFTVIPDASETPIGTSEYAFVHPGMPVGEQTLTIEDLTTNAVASINYPVNAVSTSQARFAAPRFPPVAPTGLTKITPAYLYEEYSDDDDVRAFFTAYNSQAQDYLDWFNTINLPIYTGDPIAGDLLDWVATGLYGLSRPVIAFTVVLGDGPFDTDPLDYITFAGAQSIGSSTVFTVTDDVFKRIITWNFYKGDGKTFNVRWLKRRIARFLAGVNGTDYTGPTYQISISFSGATTVNIAISAGAIQTTYAPIFQAAILSGVLPLPFQYTYNVLLS